jgi:hypothetical protein
MKQMFQTAVADLSEVKSLCYITVSCTASKADIIMD